MQNPWLSYPDSRSSSHFKIMGFALEFCVCSISPEPFEQFSLKFTQMFLSVRRCAESLTQLCRLKVKVTIQGHGIYPWICVRSISPERFERFSLNFTQMFLSVRRCAEPMTQLCRLKVKVTLQGYGILGIKLSFRLLSCCQIVVQSLVLEFKPSKFHYTWMIQHLGHMSSFYPGHIHF